MKKVDFIFIVSAIVISIPFLALEGAAQSSSSPIAVPSGYSVTLKVCHSLTATADDSPKHGHAVAFKNMVETRSKGAVKVEIYPLGQLFADPEAVIAVSNGTIFGAEVDNAVLTSWDKSYGLYSLPGIFMDFEHQERFNLSEKGGKELARRMRSRGIMVACAVSPPLHIFTARKPIRDIGDMKGLKLRVQPAEAIVKAIKAVGAQGVPMPISELHTAASTGMVDGAVTPELSISLRKLDEVFRYCLSDELFSNCVNPVVSVAQLKKMPPAVATMVEEAWMEAAKIHQDQHMRDKWQPITHRELQQRGVTFTKLTVEGREQFEKAWSSTIQELEPNIGKELIAEAVRLRTEK